MISSKLKIKHLHVGLFFFLSCLVYSNFWTCGSLPDINLSLTIYFEKYNHYGD